MAPRLLGPGRMQPVMLCEVIPPPFTTRRVRIVLALCLLGAGIVSLSGPRHVHARAAMEPHRRAYLQATKFAVVAYERWAVAHPGAGCPASFSELRRYATDRSPFDPWRGVFEMTCDANGLTVRSPGPDGVFGTADDIARTAPR